MDTVFDLPEIIGAEYAEEVAGGEAEIIDLADSLISQGAAAEDDPLAQPLLAIHRDAVSLATMLMEHHSSGSIADECCHYAAEQLKLWHLRALDVILDRFLKQD
jgi:hypothetical protein